MFKPEKSNDKPGKRRNCCGEHIQDARIAQGLTIDQFQTTLSAYGLDMNLIEVERGTCELTDIELVILATILAIAPEQLVFGDTLPDEQQFCTLLKTVALPNDWRVVHPSSGEE